MAARGFGIDFGTSNSALAMVDEAGAVRLAEWPVPENLLGGAIALAGEAGPRRSSTLPTVLFAPDYEPGMLVGHEAIARYLFTGLEGRFIQSIKAFLPQASFTGTVIRGRHMSIEEIVATYLRRFREGAEQALGAPLAGPIVLGRPARFSLEPEADRLAEERLLRAVALAGYPEVRLLIEPIAAALAYEARLDADQTVLVADLGGGTSDFTLMRVGPSHRHEKNRTESVLASGGLPVAGDAFDGEIVRARLFDELGYGASYRAFGAPTPVPHWIWHKLKRWNHVSFLKSKKYLDFLREVLDSTDRKEQIERLVRVVDEDMGFLLFRAVERAKRGVQAKRSARIADEDNDLPLDVPLSRADFAAAAQPLVEEIRSTALEVLAQAQATPASVDAVFMTGGTSLLREVRAAFAALFGEERLMSHGTFTSVVDGLARASLLDA